MRAIIKNHDHYHTLDYRQGEYSHLIGYERGSISHRYLEWLPDDVTTNCCYIFSFCYLQATAKVQ